LWQPVPRWLVMHESGTYVKFTEAGAARRLRNSCCDLPQLQLSCSLQGFQEGDEVADLVCIKAELRHGRVPGDDAFRQRFLQRLYGIAFVRVRRVVRF
jgi:hypothetical protein